MATPLTNFGLVTVSTAYGAGDTTIVLSAGHGSRLPSTSGGYTYPLTWWNATTYAHPADDPNKEIVLVTNLSTDTLTITRAQEGTSATAKNAGSSTYRMVLGITKRMFESLRTPVNTHAGLQLQTHRNAAEAQDKVELVGVDSIIMNDGVELRNDSREWSGKSASRLVSGAGGLDSGTVQAFKAYEIYAIAKEDGTRDLLLHQSKVWNYSPLITSLSEDPQSLRAATANTRVAQGYTGGVGIPVAAELKLRKVGAPTGSIWVTIEANSGGAPSGTALVTSAKLDVARLTTTFSWVRIPIDSTVTLSASTTYWFVVHGDWTINGTDYAQLSMDGTAATYSGGTKSLYNGTSWTADADDDLEFGVIIEEGGYSVILPSGYTKRCFLGWVFTDADSKFLPFMQMNKTHRKTPISSSYCGIGQMNGAVQFYSMFSHLPPVRFITALLCCTGTGTGTAVAAIGDLKATDINSSGATTGAQVMLYSGSTIVRPSQPTPVLVDTSAMMVHGTDNAQLWCTGFEW